MPYKESKVLGEILRILLFLIYYESVQCARLETQSGLLSEQNHLW